MNSLIDGVLRFQRDVFPEKQVLFQELSRGQSPSTMFISCADSRVVPEQITQQGPGSLFVVRNAGNIVPPYSALPDGVAASVEYAVAVLKVTDIIICGHSGCGAMAAMLRDTSTLTELPAIASWLGFADQPRDAVLREHAGADAEAQLTALVHENVLAQLKNLATHPAVSAAIQAQRLRLHGWFFDIGTGCITAYDVQTQRFVNLGKEALADATPLG